MLIFCCFLRVRRESVPLYRADNRQAVDGVAALGGGHHAAVRYQIVFQPLDGGVLGGVQFGAGLGFRLFVVRFHSHSPLPIQKKSAHRQRKICTYALLLPAALVDAAKNGRSILIQLADI